MRIMHVVGARPNFMKIAPIMRAMALSPDRFSQQLVHTGQHYDDNMSRVFFDDLELPTPSVNLGVGTGSHAWQTANIMLRFEPAVTAYAPDWVIVVGDVNSTLASALVCSKLGIRCAHVEAGLRSYDRTMPEEINRLLTDQIADLLFTPDREANENLKREGVAAAKIHFVGNVMIDTLARLLPKAVERPILNELGLERGDRPSSLEPYVLVTLHRPVNVDQPHTLQEIMAALTEISRRVPVIFPVHPRTRQHLASLAFDHATTSLRLIDPLGYLDFLCLMRQASVVVTDSGGVQEETTYLGVPCLTIRPNTERPVTITQGTNRLISNERIAISRAIVQALDSATMGHRTPQIPELWDGGAAGRIVEIIAVTQ
jgi:UDP-N-acetylglucosamine 2-epimerase (non-hydrolysing)